MSVSQLEFLSKELCTKQNCVVEIMLNWNSKHVFENAVVANTELHDQLFVLKTNFCVNILLMSSVTSYFWVWLIYSIPNYGSYNTYSLLQFLVQILLENSGQGEDLHSEIVTLLNSFTGVSGQTQPGRDKQQVKS